MQWQMLIWLMVAGAAGTLARYGLGGAVQNWVGVSWPWGTFVVNMLGTLAFGLIWGLWEGKLASLEVRMILLIGFMGAFTTFSSFMYETGAMIRDGEYLLAAANVVGQNVVGILCFFGGLMIGKSVEWLVS